MHMKEIISPSGPDDIGRLLREARPAPEPPTGFQNAVWRRIERAEAPGRAEISGSWLEGLSGWLLRPRFALSGMAAMLLAGAVLGALDAASVSKQAAKDRYVATVSPHALRN
jgi:hypothetical protein